MCIRDRLWAHVIDDRNTKTSQRGQQSEIEVRRVDGHEHVRTRLACRIDETSQHRERTRDDADRFGEAGDRQSAKVADEMPAGGAQTLAAEAEDLRIRLTRVQFSGERGGI